MNIKKIRLIRRFFIYQSRSRFWDLKSVFFLILGYVIGSLVSYYYDCNSVKIHHIVSHIGQHSHSKLNASELYEKVKVLCLVITCPENHQTKAIQILKTWGKRCNKVLLMSTEHDEELSEIIPLPVDEGRENLWAKTKHAFYHAYDFHFDEYDWFFKVDDDAYVVVENLRLLLYEYDARTPIYFGYRFAPYVEQGYMSGGPGYVLSKEALRRFIEVAITDENLCSPYASGYEDLELGKCLQNVDVVAGDTRDNDKRGRFFVFHPEDHLLTERIDPDFWYWKNMYYKTKDGLNCCSDYAISFHYITPEEMYIYDYFIYRAEPYGIVEK